MKTQGFIAPGFERVLDQFELNLETVEVGAAFAVYLDGRLVVDIWGGSADFDTQRPWTCDTSAVIFSGTKGVLATVLLWLCSRGVLDLDRPVAEYWPEFGEGGKQRVTVSDFATYTGGVPCISRHPVDQAMLNDPRLMARLVAQESRVITPRLIYGPYTMGWILDELCTRTTGMEAREIFRQEIRTPLGLEFGWGAQEVHDLATVHHDDDFASQYDVFNSHESQIVRDIWANPIPFTTGEVQWNLNERRNAYIPAANGAGTARSIAKLYSTLIDDVRGHNGASGAISDARSARRAIDLRLREKDEILGFDFAYGNGGFRRRSRPREGIDGDMFGHDGGGGSAHFAWPSAGVALSYTPNRLLDIGNNDHRASSLIRSLKDSLTGMPIEVAS